MTVRARSRKAPPPVPLATSGGLAETILRLVIESGDYIGRAHLDRYGRAHFLLITLPDSTFRQLERHQAEMEDAEDSDGLQTDNCDDEDNGDDEPDHDNEPDDRRLPRSPEESRARCALSAPPVEYPTTHPVTGEAGKWVLYPKARATSGN